MTDACDLLLLSDYAGEGEAAGGAGIAVSASFAALRDARITARLVTGFSVSGEARGMDSLGGCDLRAGSRLDVARAVYNPRSRVALAAVLDRLDPARTIVVLHAWTRYLTPSAVALLRDFRVMIVMHDYFWTCPNGSYFDFRREKPCERRPGGLACATTQCDRAGYGHKLGRLARHASLAWATRTMTYRPVYAHVSQRAREVALPLLRDGDHIVLYNPLPLASSSPCAGGQPKFDIGYFGRFEPQKGLVGLLDAVGATHGSGLFVGEGSLTGRIDTTPGMTRVGWQSQARTIELMRRCGAVALPSLWPETWGLITAEAMAAGVPVLVSSRAGSAELVTAFGGGVVFDPGEPEALTRGLAAVATTLPLPQSALAGLRARLSPAEHVATLRRVAYDSWGVALREEAAGVDVLAA